MGLERCAASLVKLPELIRGEVRSHFGLELLESLVDIQRAPSFLQHIKQVISHDAQFVIGTHQRQFVCGAGG